MFIGDGSILCCWKINPHTSQLFLFVLLNSPWTENLESSELGISKAVNVKKIILFQKCRTIISDENLSYW